MFYNIFQYWVFVGSTLKFFWLTMTFPLLAVSKLGSWQTAKMKALIHGSHQVELL